MTPAKENPQYAYNFGSARVHIFIGIRSVPKCVCTVIHGVESVAWIDSQRLQRSVIGKKM